MDAKPNGKIGAVMVVGGGIAGMQAALDLGNAGYKVYLVERQSAIGGRMAQLDKTFPTNDCSMCTISPRLIEVAKHLNIEVLTDTEVTSVEGQAGRFRVHLLQHPRYVDLKKCNACGDCVDVCPVQVPAEFEQGAALRKAIHKRYPQAIPNAMAISKNDRAPCGLTCPAGINVQGYVALVGAGRFEAAFRLIRQRNPLPSVCGRVCHHPCEAQCNRKDIDEPVAINPLKRFVADWVFRQRAQTGDPTIGAFPPAAIDRTKPKVAIVGGGPSGLTCACDLALRGYPVTLIEEHAQLGGMLREGIPRYRLPREMLDRDIQDIVNLGIEVRTGTRLGRDLTLSDLRRDGYQAVYLAVGLPQSAALAIEGEHLDGVMGGVDYLARASLGQQVDLGRHVAVIGGGNVAIDAARTARRLGAAQVTIVYRRTRAEMPAQPEEIEQAEAEGIRFVFLAAPVRILGAGRVQAVECQRMRLGEPDASGRRRPVPIEGETFRLEVDGLIAAVGQKADLAFIDPPLPLEAVRGLLKADPLTLATSLPGVFAGGDIAYGARSVVEAIAQGHEAATSIERYLLGQDLAAGRGGARPPAAGVPPRPFPRRARVPVPRRPVAERRTLDDEVDLTLTEEQARAEAQRCLACGLCCECLECVKVCGPGAICHDQAPHRHHVEVGAVILAPGYDPFDPRQREEYGYGRYPNVVTSLEFERILSASGPFQGHVVRPSDHRPPRRMAWIQCVGSRDPACGNDYCSSVCCMYAIKEALMAVDHVPGLKAKIFFNDIRAFGKGFDPYYENARRQGIEFQRGIVSTIKQRQQTRNLLIRSVLDDGRILEEEFDLVVLSVGLRPAAEAAALAEKFGVARNRFGFGADRPGQPGGTSRDGVFVAGAFQAPMDIPESVMGASAAAARCAEWLADVRHTCVREKTYPPERDVSAEEPRIGVFVCHCGTNIARTVRVQRVVEYARTLPYVVHAEDNLYTCSTDSTRKIVETIQHQRLNRVVVASCTPRTHEPLFQETLREAGLNKYLFEMANIRDQCSWVHAGRDDEATYKAQDLVRMAVARAAQLQPLQEQRFRVEPTALVVGGGLAGLTAALSLADQGFPCHLVEKESELGGQMRHVRFLLDGTDPQALLADQIQRVRRHPLITVHTGARLKAFEGHVGKFKTVIEQDGHRREILHGVVILATGGRAYAPTEYGAGTDPRIMTQRDLEQWLADPPGAAEPLREVVMIQCVGSREPDHPYCSRLCCQQAVKNALVIKGRYPAARVYVLFRDMRTYGFDELAYQRARDAGVLFIRFDPARPPQVQRADGRLRVEVFDDVLQRPLVLEPDRVVLSAAVRPAEDAPEVARLFKTPLTADGFFMEAHMKLRPLDFPGEGLFLAGLAHAPKSASEAMIQARGAAARAATILSRTEMLVPGSVSVVDPDRCAACLTCVRLCPYGVPRINAEHVAEIPPAACQGCGVCAAACPRKAIRLLHYEDRQILAKLKALYGDEAFESTRGRRFSAAGVEQEATP